jgi:hypothetical protein
MANSRFINSGLLYLIILALSLLNLGVESAKSLSKAEAEFLMMEDKCET